MYMLMERRRPEKLAAFNDISITENTKPYSPHV